MQAMNVRLFHSAGVLIASVLTWACALAQGVPPGYENKPLPTYPTKPSDCYVLLKNQWPYVQGGDYPVCRAVVDNLNKFCGEAPQYDVRKIHPTVQTIRQPAWEPVDAKQNMDLVKESVMANSLPKWRESHWPGIAPRVIQAADKGDLRLFRAEISVGLRLAEQTVYRVDRAGEPGTVGYNQTSLMIAAAGEKTPSPLFKLNGALRGDLWSFREAWFLVGFDPIEKRFHVKEIIRPRSGEEAPVVATPRCTFQHIDDRQGVR